MRRVASVLALLAILLSAGALGTSADTVKLKNGRVIHGQVASYGDGEFVILVRREGRDHPERLILLADSVDSIEFDAAAAAAGSPAGPLEEVIVLDASREVVPTGLDLRRGEKVVVRASGEIRLADGRVTGPAGLDATTDWPFPGERTGVLVALVGSPQSPIYHVLGQEAAFEARQPGELYLQINVPSLEGLRGAYTARIRLPERPAASRPSSPGSVFSDSDADRRALEQEFDVPADRDWLDTGLDLRAGDVLRIEASGTIHYTSSKTCGPNGGPREWRDLIRILPVNDAGRGALIGKMGEGGTVQAFFIGEEAEFTADRDGRLFLGVNDDDYGNNSGRFRVKVEIHPGG